MTLTLNPAVDQICWVPAIEEHVKVRAHEARFEPGGGGINVARALHDLEAQARALWTSGGEIGRLLGRLLDEDGIDHRPIPVEGMTRCNLAVFEDESENGQELLFDMPGPELDGPEIGRWMQAVGDLDAGHVVISGRRPPDGGHVYGRLVHRLEQRSNVVLDTSGPGLARTLDEGVFLAKPNRDELADLVGRELASLAEVEQAAGELVGAGMAEIVVVSLGAEGALAVADGETVRVQAPPVRALSNVGAGDSMVAGLTHRLAEGDGLEQAVRYGVAAGADAVRRPGTELCTRDGVEELLAQTSIRPGSP